MLYFWMSSNGLNSRRSTPCRKQTISVSVREVQKMGAFGQADALLVVLVGLLSAQVWQIYTIRNVADDCRCDATNAAGPTAPPSSLRDSSMPPRTATAPSVAPSRPAASRQDDALLRELSELTREPVASPPSSAASSVSSGVVSQPSSAASSPASLPVETGMGVQPAANSLLAGSSGAGPQRHGLTLKQYLQQYLPHGLGIFLGVGRNRLPGELLREWSTSPGLYLVDPFIHIWAGYEDPANLSDGENQILFEQLQADLKPHENRYSFVRDFSHSFLVTYKGTPGSPPTSLLYVDNTQTKTAILRDLRDWWELVAQNGIAAGPQFHSKTEVKAAVEEFCRERSLVAQVFSDNDTWFIMKP
ncbi:unnamed protein product [Amoebophrya sp. A25]|nr:unnamed protein product [Amoebophrya sp. A25]|eukprot:GSA25T00007524001.1